MQAEDDEEKKDNLHLYAAGKGDKQWQLHFTKPDDLEDNIIPNRIKASSRLRNNKGFKSSGTVFATSERMHEKKFNKLGT